MSRANWAKIRQSVGFYRNTYRLGSTILLASVLVNVFLGIAIYHECANQPEHDFYATDGVTPPVKLTAMNHENNSSSALLADEQNNNDNSKAMPQ